MRAGSAGFTMVELIAVIVVMGILAFGTTRFLTDASNGFVTTQSRTQLVADVESGWMTMARRLRSALPGSVRTSSNGACVEYLPVWEGTRYLNAPVGVAGSQVWVVPPPGFTLSAGTRLAIPQSQSLYALPDPGPVSPLVSAANLLPDGRLRLSLASSHRFSVAGARERVYFVTTPESFCVDGGVLWQYRNYGYMATQPLPASLPGALPDRLKVIAEVGSALPIFSHSPPTLHRNGSVAIELLVTRADDQVQLEQTVNIRNVL